MPTNPARSIYCFSVDWLKRATRLILFPFFFSWGLSSAIHILFSAVGDWSLVAPISLLLQNFTNYFKISLSFSKLMQQLHVQDSTCYLCSKTVSEKENVYNFFLLLLLSVFFHCRCERLTPKQPKRPTISVPNFNKLKKYGRALRVQ